MERHYENAPEYQADTYRIVGGSIAWRILGWETEPVEDTEWSGCENRTGKLVAVMIGDDGHHAVDPEDVAELADDAYCHECGQIGCTHDGRGRQ
jgi:hypothetical protein